jgi:hypothetical protein
MALHLLPPDAEPVCAQSGHRVSLLFIVLVGGLGSMRGVAIATVLLGAGPELIGFVTT